MPSLPHLAFDCSLSFLVRGVGAACAVEIAEISAVDQIQARAVRCCVSALPAVCCALCCCPCTADPPLCARRSPSAVLLRRAVLVTSSAAPLPKSVGRSLAAAIRISQ